MAFWVYGRDANTGAPGQMLSDAATPEAAREQAIAQGLTPERVEFQVDPPDPNDPLAPVRLPPATRWVLADIDVPFVSVLRFIVYVNIANLLIGIPVCLAIAYLFSSIKR